MLHIFLKNSFKLESFDASDLDTERLIMGLELYVGHKMKNHNGQFNTKMISVL